MAWYFVFHQVLLFHIPLISDHAKTSIATMLPIFTGSVLAIQLKLGWGEKAQKCKKSEAFFLRLYIYCKHSVNNWKLYHTPTFNFNLRTSTFFGIPIYQVFAKMPHGICTLLEKLRKLVTVFLFVENLFLNIHEYQILKRSSSWCFTSSCWFFIVTFIGQW